MFLLLMDLDEASSSSEEDGLGGAEAAVSSPLRLQGMVRSAAVGSYEAPSTEAASSSGRNAWFDSPGKESKEHWIKLQIYNEDSGRL